MGEVSTDGQVMEVSPPEVIAGANVSSRCALSRGAGLARGVSGGGGSGGEADGSNISIFRGVLLTGNGLACRGGTGAFGVWALGAAFGVWALGVAFGISAIGLGISTRGFGVSTFGLGTSLFVLSTLGTATFGTATFGISGLAACAWGVSALGIFPGVAAFAEGAVSGAEAVSTRGWRRGNCATEGWICAIGACLAAG